MSGFIFGAVCFVGGFVLGAGYISWRALEHERRMGMFIRACLRGGALRHLETLASSLDGEP